MRRRSLPLSHHGGSMMTTDVEECAKLEAVISDHDDGLSTDIGGYMMTRLFKLIQASSQVPVLRENCLEFEIVELFVDVPRRRNRISTIKRLVWIVRFDDLLERTHNQ